MAMHGCPIEAMPLNYFEVYIMKVLLLIEGLNRMHHHRAEHDVTMYIRVLRSV